MTPGGEMFISLLSVSSFHTKERSDRPWDECNPYREGGKHGLWSPQPINLFSISCSHLSFCLLWWQKCGSLLSSIQKISSFPYTKNISQGKRGFCLSQSFGGGPVDKQIIPERYATLYYSKPAPCHKPTFLGMPWNRTVHGNRAGFKSGFGFEPGGFGFGFKAKGGGFGFKTKGWIWIWIRAARICTSLVQKL